MTFTTLLLCVGFFHLAGSPTPVLPAAQVSTGVLDNLPLSFEANIGQTDDAARYIARGSGFNLFLTENEAVWTLSGPSSDEDSEEGLGPYEPMTVVRMQIIGANPHPTISGLDELTAKSNYFRGQDPSQWLTDVPNYSKVLYQSIYPGIDLVYYGNEVAFAYDFLLAPGVDPNEIKLSFTGTDGIKINRAGNLVLSSGGGELVHQAPVIYQEVDGLRMPVQGSYILRHDTTPNPEIGFNVGIYDDSLPLVIDPTITYSSFLGGTKEEFGLGIAVDGYGEAYITGYTLSIDFPNTGGLYTTNSGDKDAFITKVDSTGSSIVYSTYLGGSDRDEGNGITVDLSGSKVYVTGITQSTDFPTVNPNQTDQGSFDAFVAVLDSAGSVLEFSTYLGGGDIDNGVDVAVEKVGGSGRIWVTGVTESSNLPLGGGCVSGPADAFVVMFEPNSTSTGYNLLMSECLGGSDYDDGYSIALDGSGEPYVAGRTNLTDFPTVTPIQTDQPGDDVFVTKYYWTGSQWLIDYSTYLGSAGDDFGQGIAVDVEGNAYVIGWGRCRRVPDRLSNIDISRRS